MKRDEMIKTVLTERAAKIVTITTRTLPEVRKGQGTLIKISRVNGILNCASFGERVWGKRIMGTSVIEHDGRMYLEIVVHSRVDRWIDMASMTDVSEEEAMARVLRRPRDEERQIRDFNVDSIICWAYRGNQEVLEL